MKELAVPDKTKCMASKAAVDLHDHLKRDMMTLFSLEKVLQKKVRTAHLARDNSHGLYIWTLFPKCASLCPGGAALVSASKTQWSPMGIISLHRILLVVLH